MAKANVTPDAIKKIAKLIKQTEQNISDLNITLSDTYSTLLDVENTIAHLQRSIGIAESMLKPDAIHNNTDLNLVNTEPTGDNRFD